ncbi:MAG TPA: sigma-70 family RNA polymerase sigma factor [Gemmatimonadaceae bacterium]
MTPTHPALRDRTDDLLLARVRDGDDAALRVIFDRYAATLHRCAFRLLGSSDDADDVVQDVFVGLRAALKRYDELGKFESWLKRVAVRAALMRLRSDRRRESAALGAPIAASSFPDRDPKLQDTLAAAVAGLAPALRTVFVLRMIEDYSHDEIADVLGISTSACKVRLHRALRQLRPLLSHLRRD